MRARQHIPRGVIKRLVAGMTLAVACVAVAAAQTSPPREVVERLHASLLEVMRHADELGYEGRYRQLAPVLEASYDFPFMTRIAIGTSWRDMTAEQRDDLVALFTEMSIASYAARFDGYGGEAFEVGLYVGVD